MIKEGIVNEKRSRCRCGRPATAFENDVACCGRPECVEDLHAFASLKTAARAGLVGVKKTARGR